MKMDRRRLEHAHIRYAVLNVAEWYHNFDVKKILFTSDQSEKTLQEFTPLYMKAFYEMYSSKYTLFTVWLILCICGWTGHRCLKAGCGTVLIIDGNLKNHRSVCAASEAGYVQYDGLQGKIKTGCTNTPSQKSRFCLIHKPRTLDSQEEVPGTAIDKFQYLSVNHI